MNVIYIYIYDHIRFIHLLLTSIIYDSLNLFSFDCRLELASESMKKIAYSNYSDFTQEYTIISNDELLVKPVTEKLTIKPKRKAYIRLRFMKQDKELQKNVLIFVKNQNGKYIENMCLNIQWN